ncbi:MAG: glutathione S-transferase N-terminal domain-containing protein [Endozoicomonadaceae bacterium]|nr:glutathione S-transferase N-terminal domain-containing protein [Endozoicomonadaceae bacterium]MCY4330594.1 glutathione S-transferase N-terminal domain-containing protein [Endozoicomonadaceae bacterium]
MGVIAKRSLMTFFSDPCDHYCHRVRIVLAEKDLAVDIKDVDPANQQSSSLADVNPYNTVPTLMDRDLTLYQSVIIMEYLDERFPHPPLLPAYPVMRSKSRLMIHRIEKDLCPLVDIILNPASKETTINRSRKHLREQLLSISPIFAENEFFMSEEFSLVDCCLLPILWRLPRMKIELPQHAAPILQYIKRLSKRPSFKTSLSDAEKEMRSE